MMIATSLHVSSRDIFYFKLQATHMYTYYAADYHTVTVKLYELPLKTIHYREYVYILVLVMT